jgi:hypothetical protein
LIYQCLSPIEAGIQLFLSAFLSASLSRFFFLPFLPPTSLILQKRQGQPNDFDAIIIEKRKARGRQRMDEEGKILSLCPPPVWP